MSEYWWEGSVGKQAVYSATRCTQCGKRLDYAIYWETGIYTNDEEGYFRGEDYEGYQSGSAYLSGNQVGKPFCSAGCRAQYLKDNGIPTRGASGESVADQIAKEREEIDEWIHEEAVRKSSFRRDSVKINGAYYNADKTVLLGIDDDVKNLVIPDGVLEIAEKACHENENLSSVKMPDSLTKIGPAAFLGCKQLKEIDIPKSVTVIEGGAFSESGLKKVTIPKTVKTFTIYEYEHEPNAFKPKKEALGAFTYCEELETVVIEEGKTVCGNQLFRGCRELTSVTLPSTLKTISPLMFTNCKNLKNITLPSGLTKIGTLAFAARNMFEISGLESITIPSSVTEVGDYAFGGCSHLRSVSIGDGAVLNGNGIFYDCDNLTSIVIPSGTTILGEKFFCKCTKLETITIPSGITKFGKECFHITDSLRRVNVAGGKLSKEAHKRIKQILPSNVIGGGIFRHKIVAALFFLFVLVGLAFVLVPRIGIFDGMSKVSRSFKKNYKSDWNVITGQQYVHYSVDGKTGELNVDTAVIFDKNGYAFGSDDETYLIDTTAHTITVTWDGETEKYSYTTDGVIIYMYDEDSFTYDVKANAKFNQENATEVIGKTFSGK